MSSTTTERACGGCVACCVYLNVDRPEFRKPALSHCPHLRLTNPIEPGVLQLSTDEPCACGLFGSDERPAICGEYLCSWRAGHGAECDRPDRSLILSDQARQVEGAIECRTLAEDADETEAGMGAILRLSRSADAPAVVWTFGESRLKRIVGRSL